MGRRRGHGEGSIHKRKDGRWAAVVNIGIIGGKRRRKYVYGVTRKEVAEALRLLQSQQQQGLNIAPDRLTVAAFLQQWLEQTIKPSRRSRTYQSYELTVRLHIAPRIGHHQLVALTPSHCQAMINDLVSTDLSPRSVQYARGVLQRALNRAIKWGYITRNPVLATDPPRGSKRPITPLTREEAQRLIDVVKGHRLEALYRVALSLGLRRGEILALQWSDIDFDTGTLRVSKSLQRADGKLVLSEPKSAAGIRILPLPPVLAQALQEHMQRQKKERAFWGTEWHDLGFVFPASKGTPMEPVNLLRHFKAALKAAKLPHIRFHDLRHSCATFLIAQGVHPRVIMEILGHSHISLTMNTYSHVLPDTLRDAASKVDDLLNQEKKEDEEASSE